MASALRESVFKPACRAQEYKVESRETCARRCNTRSRLALSSATACAVCASAVRHTNAATRVSRRSTVSSNFATLAMSSRNRIKCTRGFVRLSLLTAVARWSTEVVNSAAKESEARGEAMVMLCVGASETSNASKLSVARYQEGIRLERVLIALNPIGSNARD